MTQKLDKEHLTAINELQQNFSAIMQQIGSVTVDLEFLESQKKLAEEKKNSLIAQFSKLREQEEQVLEQLKSHYGEGQINIQDGTFTPAPAGQAV